MKSYDELVSALKGLHLSDLTIRELEYLEDLLNIKSRVIEKEIRKRKIRGEKN